MKSKCLLAVSFLLLFVCLAGCGKSHPDNTVQPVTTGFSCCATIRYHEMDLQADLTRGQDGKLTLAFSLPKTLEGVALGWNGADMTMELGNMSVTVPADKVPQGALIQRLLQVLAASHEGGTVTDEGYAVQGEIEGEAYTLVCHPDTGLPETLSYPAEELQVTFSDAKIL